MQRLAEDKSYGRIISVIQLKVSTWWFTKRATSITSSKREIGVSIKTDHTYLHGSTVTFPLRNYIHNSRKRKTLFLSARLYFCIIFNFLVFFRIFVWLWCNVFARSAVFFNFFRRRGNFRVGGDLFAVWILQSITTAFFFWVFGISSRCSNYHNYWERLKCRGIKFTSQLRVGYALIY